ncbi:MULTISPECIES: ABC transporter permease [Sediminimonas]|uniref:ABC transporter permease n=1 Tax=Sediminimonas qiaohouensis TaxID=552061 RepID=A0A7C9L6K0_9RHOB|nr:MULTISPECIES: ABC transporter permease [Sediminimonas]MDR9483764.1 ABC transporter permease [Sediminimonas sp.]MTJ03853.1 ABC transporter permease [Sediminimonas qiaohouensis]
MLHYTLQRAALAVAIVFVAISALYMVMITLPGDPTSVLLGPRATPEIRAEFRAQMGLDDPVLMQLAQFWGRVLSGDLGTDYYRDRPVADAVMGALPHTVALVVGAIVWSATLGILLGAFSADNRNTWLDRVSGVLSVGFIAAPSFVVALYALLFFAVTLGWFPTIGAGEPGDLGSRLYHLALPSFAIGLAWVGYVARIVRASMLEALGENYIRTARAFGLPRRKVIYSYALRVAILPAVQVLGVGIGGMLSSAVFAEIVFSRPGIGSLIYDSVSGRNYPLVMGAMLVAIGFFVTCALVADLINAALDPRHRKLS